MKYLLVALCCSSLYGYSQDLSGIWRGSFHSTSNKMMLMLGQDDKYKFEVQLDQHGKHFTGVTYSYKTTVFYGKASCSGAINTSTKKVLLEELKMLELRMALGGDACIMTLFMQYSKSGGEEFLEGTYTSMNVRTSTNCGSGTIFLRKVTTSDFYKEPFIIAREKKKAAKKPDAIAKKTTPIPPHTQPGHKPPATHHTTPSAKKIVPKPEEQTKTQPSEKPTIVKADTVVKIKPKLPEPSVVVPRVLATRENELVRTITTSARDIQIDLYDNGTIDNDTISVYLDNKQVVHKQRLTEQPITVKLHLDNEDSHELVMVAENLGEIPPNTSLMVVRAGDKQYEVRITSTEQKNAVVKFKYGKGE